MLSKHQTRLMLRSLSLGISGTMLYPIYMYMCIVDLLASIVNFVFNKNLKLSVSSFVKTQKWYTIVPLCQCWWGRTSPWFPFFLHPGLIPFCTLNTSLIFLLFFLHDVIKSFLLFFLHLFFYLFILVLFPTMDKISEIRMHGFVGSNLAFHVMSTCMSQWGILHCMPIFRLSQCAQHIQTLTRELVTS